MAEEFNAKKAGKAIKDIKNEKINPYRDAMEYGSRTDFMMQQVLKKQAKKGYESAIKIEQQAEKAGVNLDKDAMRRLDKIKTRYADATGKSNFVKMQSDQVYKDNEQSHKDFISGKTAAERKERSKGR